VSVLAALFACRSRHWQRCCALVCRHRATTSDTVNRRLDQYTPRLRTRRKGDWRADSAGGRKACAEPLDSKIPLECGTDALHQMVPRQFAIACLTQSHQNKRRANGNGHIVGQIATRQTHTRRSRQIIGGHAEFSTNCITPCKTRFLGWMDRAATCGCNKGSNPWHCWAMLCGVAPGICATNPSPSAIA